MGVLIMKDYLAIIRKIDFINLFKYGQFTISFAIPFDGNLIKHSDDSELFDNLTSKMNMFEYSFEYLIIHFKSDDYNDKDVIDIKNVCTLYTFDQDAKKEMSISFDPRIQLHVSPWADKFAALQRNLFIKQSLKGIDNLWTIFQLSDKDKTKCGEIITESIVQEVFNELYSNERPSGHQSIWTYLLRYERHSFYPKGMIGYFYDFIHVCCNYIKKRELSGEVAESTDLYKNQLKVCKEDKFDKLLEVVKASPLYDWSIREAGCRFAVAAPLFLFLKAKFANGLEYKPDEKLFEYAQKVSGFEFAIVVYLLGLTLGYDKTYDSYYEAMELPIFKKGTKKDSPSKSIDDTETVLPTKQGQLFPENSNFENPQSLPIVWMRHKKQGIKPAYNEEERDKLTNLGYTPSKKFTAKDSAMIASLGFNPEQEKKRYLKSIKNKDK